MHHGGNSCSLGRLVVAAAPWRADATAATEEGEDGVGEREQRQQSVVCSSSGGLSIEGEGDEKLSDDFWIRYLG